MARGDNPHTIEALVRAWASRCSPPLEEHEWKPHLLKLTAKEQSKVFVGDVSSDKLEDGCRKVELASEDNTITSSTFSLQTEAYYGLFGEMLKAVEQETEAHPAVILVGWLTAFGNIVGRNAYMGVGADIHYPTLYTAIVGKSSDAKGVAWSVVRQPFNAVGPLWSSRCICHGVSTGQGLIDRVRDERKTLKFNRRTGEVEEETIPGADDKRCLVRLDELSLCFRLQAAKENTLSETLLTAWGGSAIETPNTSQGDNYRKASDYTISVYGDIQPHSLRRILEKGGLEAVNGWMNRFLWVSSNSQRDIPHPKPVEDLLSPYYDKLSAVLLFAQTCGEMAWSDDAKTLWEAVYGELKRSADSIPHTDRARPQVLRLAMLFAMSDKSKVIRREHLQAALSVWAYCRSSCEELFGAVETEAEAEPLWLTILNMLPQDGGWVKRGQFRDSVVNRFRRKHSVEELDAVLEKLEASDKVEVEVKATAGRSGERWKRKVDTISSSTTEMDGCSVVAEEEEATSETKTSSSSSASSGGLKFETKTSSSSASISAEKKSGEEKKGEQVMNNEKVEMVSTSNPAQPKTDNLSERRL